MNEYIDIFYYKPPGLPLDPSHKIDVKNKEDKYNPFNDKNLIYKSSIILNKKIIFDIENLLYKQIVETQMNEFQMSMTYRSYLNSIHQLNDVLKLHFTENFNNFLDIKHDLLHRILKDKICPYVFCMAYLPFAKIGMQLFLLKFKEFFISNIYMIYIDLHNND